MPSVGEILAAERRRQGKALAAVSGGTKIRARVLEDLESGRHDRLPDPAYVKGYIQAYARFLEIPYEGLLDQYREDIKAAPATSGRSQLDIPQQQLVPHREAQHAIPRVVWSVTAVLVVVLLLVGGIWALLANRVVVTPTPPVDTASVVPTASPGIQTTSSAPAGTPFKLRLTVRQGTATFVKATIDGLLAANGTLQGGESREWLVSDIAVLGVRNRSAVTVTRDGTPVTLTPVSGGISETTLKAGQ